MNEYSDELSLTGLSDEMQDQVNNLFDFDDDDFDLGATLDELPLSESWV